MRILLTATFVVLATPALAGPRCTNEPESKWLSRADMLERIKPLGHRVEVLKKTRGNCYEIYGRDKSGRRIEVYFHPISGDVVKASRL